MDSLLGLSLILAVLLLVGIANAWVAPKLFPIAGRVPLRLVHVVVLAAPLSSIALVLLAAEMFPGSLLERVALAPDAVVATGVGAFVVAVVFAFAFERRR